MSFKQRLTNWTYSIISILVLVSAFNYVIDPYQIFHKHAHGLSINTRYQNAGLINNYLDDTFNALVIGTSMVENFQPHEIQNKLKWGKVLKLPAPGSEPSIQMLFLQEAIKHGKIKHVLMGIHTTYTNTNITKIDQESTMPTWLYNDNFFDIYTKYLLNIKTLKLSKKILDGSWHGQQDINLYSNWMNKYQQAFEGYNTHKNLEALNSKLDKRRASNKNYKYHFKDNYPAFQKLLIPFIKSNPDIQFILFFPPYSTYFYSISSNEKLSSILAMRRALLYQTFNLSNVSVYAFDNFSFVNELSNYKDDEHYSDKINSLIIDSIANKKGILTLANIDTYENDFLLNVKNFEIQFSNNIINKGN